MIVLVSQMCQSSICKCRASFLERLVIRSRAVDQVLEVVGQGDLVEKTEC